MPRAEGNFVRKGRRKIGISQQEFANRLGVSIATVANWEHNVNAPLMKHAVNLAALLNLPLETVCSEIAKQALLISRLRGAA